MPMDKNTTPDKVGHNDEKVVAPSVSTLNFLKLFARAYYADKEIERSLDAVVLN